MISHSSLRGLTVGDLVYYRLNKNNKSESESYIDKARVGIIVELAKKTAMGFQMVYVMWNSIEQVECIGENHIHKVKINET
jgi:hypothetical protein